MAKVAVRERVGTGLQPDNNGVKLAYGPNARVLDGIEDNRCCNGQSKSGIDCVPKCDPAPCTPECCSFLVCLGSIYSCVTLFPLTKGSIGVLHSDPFYHVGGE
ncbi:hypothetical protein ES702_00231 [subsurface metagenome]